MSLKGRVVRAAKDAAGFARQSIPAGLRATLQPRRFLAFNIGVPRSGTVSIARMFETHYRADHEVERPRIIGTMYASHTGALSDEGLVRELQRRDRRLWLELESSCFLGFRPDLLRRAFPEARFLLTIRQPQSWLPSIFDLNLLAPAAFASYIAQYHEMFFQPGNYPHTPHDRLLEEHGLYSLDAYLSYWTRANTAALEGIGERDLLKIPTGEIGASAGAMARFLGVSEDTIDLGSSHTNRTRKPHGLYEKLDPAFVEDRIEVHTGELARRLFASEKRD